MSIAALRRPAVLGSKVTVKLVAPAGVSVTGSAMPLTLKSAAWAPLVMTAVTSRSPEASFWIVKTCWTVPSLTGAVPKSVSSARFGVRSPSAIEMPWPSTSILGFAAQAGEVASTGEAASNTQKASRSLCFFRDQFQRTEPHRRAFTSVHALLLPETPPGAFLSVVQRIAQRASHSDRPDRPDRPDRLDQPDRPLPITGEKLPVSTALARVKKLCADATER
jgi:hypothetical protein